MTTTVETKAKKEKRNAAIPPYYIIKSGNKLIIEEDLKPFSSKDECKLKINELKSLDENEFIIFRIHKHYGRFFIYRKK